MSTPTIAAATVTVTATTTVYATITAQPEPIYFELCWSIMSTIGLFNTFVGFLVIGIVGFSSLTIFPILASIGVAIGNGLIFPTYYSNTSNNVKIVTSPVVDISLLIADLMIPCYSFFIIRIITRGRERIFHHIVFAIFIGGLIGCRLAIVYERVMLVRINQLAQTSLENRTRVNFLHVGSFIGLALAEIWNGAFLIKKFLSARTRRDSLHGALQTDAPRQRFSHFGHRGFNLYAMLTRSTEVRLALLAFVGIMRAITYPFQAAAVAANNVPSQIDRFAATIGCLVPMILYVDLIASKLAYQLDRAQKRGYSDTNGSSFPSKHRGSNTPSSFRSPKPIDWPVEITVEEGIRRRSEAGLKPAESEHDAEKNSAQPSIANLTSRASHLAQSQMRESDEAP